MMQPIAVIASFAILGVWLESINGKRGLVDEFLTPVPLAFASFIYELTRGFAS